LSAENPDQNLHRPRLDLEVFIRTYDPVALRMDKPFANAEGTFHDTSRKEG
jgi:hypothetical protein